MTDSRLTIYKWYLRACSVLFYICSVLLGGLGRPYWDLPLEPEVARSEKGEKRHFTKGEKVAVTILAVIGVIVLLFVLLFVLMIGVESNWFRN